MAWLACIVMSAFLILGGSVSAAVDPDARGAGIALAAIGAGIALYSLIKYIQHKRAKKRVKLKKTELGAQQAVTLKHVTGLPVAAGASCTIYMCPDKYVFVRNDNTFILPFEKVRDASIKTDTEITSNYVSSVGGAVGGAMLLGPLGAMIGGRAKKKTSAKVERYIIFAYEKDAETVDFITFDCTKGYLKAKGFESAYKRDKSRQARTVEL